MCVMCCAGVEEKQRKEDEVHVSLLAWMKQEEEGRWPLVSSPTPSPAPDEYLLRLRGVCVRVCVVVRCVN